MLATAGQWTAVDSIRIVVTARAAHSNSLHYDRMFLALADGDTERAIDEFGRGLDAHESVFLTTAIGCDPLFTPMLDKPRFAEILRRYGSQSCKVQDRWPVAPRPKASR